MKAIRLLRAFGGMWSATPKVVTFSEADLRRSSRDLAAAVAAGGFRPSQIVAIASGGVPVAKVVAESFPLAELVVVAARRPGTAMKTASPVFGGIMRRLPYAITSLLRKAEHWWRFAPRDFKSEPVAYDEHMDWPTVSGEARQVLIVDDAVDTGESMERVLSAAKRKYPAAMIQTATLTISGVNPLARCDYALLRDVNIRFYWSKDYH